MPALSPGVLGGCCCLTSLCVWPRGAAVGGSVGEQGCLEATGERSSWWSACGPEGTSRTPKDALCPTGHTWGLAVRASGREWVPVPWPPLEVCPRRHLSWK